MPVQQIKAAGQPDPGFETLLREASRAADQDPRLSPAAKFGLTTEFKGLRKLGARFQNWQVADTRQLITHLAHINQLSTNISHLLLTGLEKWPFLLPESFILAILQQEQTRSSIPDQSTS